MTVHLYDYWRSSASCRVRIALNLKGIHYKTTSVDLVTDDHRSPEHLARNPLGLVPALEIDGLMLTQSLAILEYLEETRPSPALLPTDPAARAYVRALSLAIACEIHPLCNSSSLKRIEALAGEAGRNDWNSGYISRGLTAFEGMLEKSGLSGQFCYGDLPGMADCLLMPQLYNATRWSVGFDHLPRISSIATNCAALPAFEAARPENVKPG